MAYNITVVASTKDAARAALVEHLDAAIAEAVEHSHEREHVLAAVDGFLGLMRAPVDGEGVVLTVNGSIAGDHFAGCSHVGVYVNATVGVLAQTD